MRARPAVLSIVLFLPVGPFSDVPLAAQDRSFVLHTQTLAPYTPAYLGNGQFSMTTSPRGTSPTLSYMVGVYDHGEADIPRIAALPAWNEVNFFDGKSWLNDAELRPDILHAYAQRLDMYNGCIETTYEWVDEDQRTSVDIQAFVSRANPNLAAIKFQINPHYSGKVKLSFPIRAWKAPRRLALAQLEKIAPDPPGVWPSAWYPGYMGVKDRRGEAKAESGWLWVISQAEGRSTVVGQAAAVTWPVNLRGFSSNVGVAEDNVSIEISFEASAGKSYAFYKYVSAVSSHDTPTPLEKASQTVQAAKPRGYDSILNEHIQAWHKLWETDIGVEGDPDLQKVVHSMIFYLLCSVREGMEFSIPPMGLSTAGYYGHVFWDADTWMFPALLLMHPELAKSMVMFRYRTLEAAKLNARLNAYQGAMYPWEADELGQETTPKFAYQNALYENHVTGDAARAQWQYYLATGDTGWLALYGYPVLKATADFWSSRATYDEQKARYNIRNIVSVDEGLIGIGNDTYTNAVARQNLEIAVAASVVLGKEVNPLWEQIIPKLYIPYDAQNEYHPTYENAPPSAAGSVVPLLSYPLQLPMVETAKRNNMKNAMQRVAEHGSGAMMTITLYPIVAAELREAGWFNDLVPTSYKGYLRPPFNVLAEAPTNQSTNFITGAGGFLQQVIYGYSGLRLSKKGLSPEFKPLLPIGVTTLTLKGFSVKGKKVDIVVAGDKVKFQ